LDGKLHSLGMCVFRSTNISYIYCSQLWALIKIPLTFVNATDVLCKANVIEIPFLERQDFDFIVRSFFFVHVFFPFLTSLVVVSLLFEDYWKNLSILIPFQQIKKRKNSLKIDFHSLVPHNRNKKIYFCIFSRSFILEQSFGAHKFLPQ
jgi:hypothetical protein